MADAHDGPRSPKRRRVERLEIPSLAFNVIEKSKAPSQKMSVIPRIPPAFGIVPVKPRVLIQPILKPLRPLAPPIPRGATIPLRAPPPPIHFKTPLKSISTGTNPRFVNGGLAAQASALYNRGHTGLVLWQKETERRRASTVPDLTATIVKILHSPLRNTTKPLPVLTLCRIHLTESTSNSYAPNQLYKIIFSQSQLSLDQFKEGLIVRIYQPWNEVCLVQTPSIPVSNDSSSLPFHRSSLGSPRLPSSPPSTPNVSLDDKTALLCSRFIF